MESSKRLHLKLGSKIGHLARTIMSNPLLGILKDMSWRQGRSCSKEPTLLSSNYHPKIDMSPELGEIEASYFWGAKVDCQVRKCWIWCWNLNDIFSACPPMERSALEIDISRLCSVYESTFQYGAPNNWHDSVWMPRPVILSVRLTTMIEVYLARLLPKVIPTRIYSIEVLINTMTSYVQ